MGDFQRIDNPSVEHRFGWEKVEGVENEEDLAIPVLLRFQSDERYSPTRIVEQEIIKKYGNLPSLVFQCITLKSFYLTPAEAKLMSHINFFHCNSRYGEDLFSQRDVLISCRDVKQLAKFLQYSSRVNNCNDLKSNSSAGIVKVCIDQNNPNLTMLVPYVARAHALSEDKEVKFVPLKIIEQFIVSSSKSVKGIPSDWDIMYLKMLSVYCKNNTYDSITREDFIYQLDGLVYRNTDTDIIYEEFLGYS